MGASGLTFAVLPNALKLAMAFGQWNFTQPNNTLRFYLSLFVQPQVTNITRTNPSVATSNTTTFVLESADIMTSTINLLNSATADQISVPISFTLTPNSLNASLLDLTFDFPAYNSSLTYDPDFSVILQGSNNNNGGDGGDDTTLIIALAVGLGAGIPLVAFVLFVIIVTVVAVVACIAKKKMAASLAGGGNVSF